MQATAPDRSLCGYRQLNPVYDRDETGRGGATIWHVLRGLPRP
jgi:hypothetical protein